MARDNGALKRLSPSELAEAFRAELERQGKPRHTIRAYLGDLSAFLEHFTQEGGSHFPAGVRPADVRAFFVALRRAGAKPATLHRRRAGLAAFYRWAVAEGACRETPVVEISLPPIESPLRRALDDRELRRYLRTVRVHGSLRDQAVCELLAATAIREGELTQLRLEDLVITERRGRMTVQGKGMRQRLVPLHRDARAALSAWLKVRPNLGPHLFPGPTGGALHTSTIRRLVDKYERLSGVDTVTPHVLRHTVATDLVRRKKVDLVIVQRLLGHTKLSTTERYTVPNLEDLDAAVSRLVDDE